MPSNYPAIEQPPQDHNPTQVKQCSRCQGQLTVEPVNLPFFDSNDTTNVCTSCRDQMLSSLGGLQRFYDENDSQGVRRVSPRIAPAYGLALSHSETHIQDERPLGNDTDMSGTPRVPEILSVIPELATSFRRSPTPPPPTVSNQHTTLRIVCDTDVPPTRVTEPHKHAMGASSHFRPRTSAASSPDPLVDITRIRIRSRGHHCLYPGASFQGTQKSGRNSYDVNVTVVVCRCCFPLKMFLNVRV